MALVGAVQAAEVGAGICAGDGSFAEARGCGDVIDKVRDRLFAHVVAAGHDVMVDDGCRLF